MWNKKTVSISSAFKRSQQGLTLIETLVSIFLISIVVVVYLQSLVTTTTATTLIHHRNVAESLARSQMDYIKGQDFSADIPWDYEVSPNGRSYGEKPSWWYFDPKHPPLLHEVYGAYIVECSAKDIPIDIDNDGTDDVDVREITVKVSNQDVDDSVLILEGYKINR
jgi:prepilin-type N-terminal cleavage/methylation domain-containing protein